MGDVVSVLVLYNRGIMCSWKSRTLLGAKSLKFSQNPYRLLDEKLTPSFILSLRRIFATVRWNCENPTHTVTTVLHKLRSTKSNNQTAWVLFWIVFNINYHLFPQWAIKKLNSKKILNITKFKIKVNQNYIGHWERESGIFLFGTCSDGSGGGNSWEENIR